MRFRQIALGFYMPLFLVGSSFMLSASTVQAAGPSANWIDVTQINATNIPNSGDGIFKSSDKNFNALAGGVTTYTRQNDPDPCPDTLTIDNPGVELPTVTIQQKTKAPGDVGPCFNGQKISHIPTTNVKGAETDFAWVASNSIQNVTGVNTYNLSTDVSPNSFVQNETNPCKDIIQANPGASSGTLFYRSDQPIKDAGPGDLGDPGGGNNHPYSGYSILGNVDISHANSKLDGCYFTSGQVYLGATDKSTEPPIPPTPPQGSADTTCNIPYISWIVCPLITIGYKVIHFLEGQVGSLLQTPDLTPIQPIWAAFRNLANVLFVLLFLIIIFSNVLSIHLDAYTVKKLLPKLVMAAILVQFSFFLCQMAIDISNITGVGISSLIPAVGKAQNNAGYNYAGITEGILLVGGGIGGAVIGTIAAPEIAIGVIITVLLLIISGLASIFVVFMTLTIRIIVIELFVILAPVAFALWVLPNTEKYFKDWLENFIKLLIMYPLIRLLLAAGELANQVANNGGGGSGNANNFGIHLAGTIAPIAVFFLIPATFKLAGRALNKITGASLGKVGSFGSNLRKGQLAQNVKKTVQEGAAAKLLQNDQKGIRGFGARTFGRAVTGNAFSFGAPGKRKIAATAAAARAARFKDHVSAFEENNYSNKDLQKIAEAYLDMEAGIGDGKYEHVNQDGSVERRKLTDGQGEAAVAYMGSHGGDLEIAKLLEQRVYDKAPIKGVWNPDTKKTDYSFDLNDSQKKAKAFIDRGLILGGAKGNQAKPSPHLVKDAGAFGEGTNEGVIAALKGPSGRTGANAAFSMGANAAQKNLDSLFALTKNQDLAKDMDKDTVLAYRQHAINYLTNNATDPNINYDVINSQGQKISLLKHLSNAMTTGGSIITDMGAVRA